LTHLNRIDPMAVVAFFPSDHHFANEDAFAAHLNIAFAQAEQHRERVILLGIAPDSPEEAYGWIEPGTSLPESPAFEVRGFREKPSRRVAARLMRGGSLWNSFVMVGHVSAFLEMVRRTLPDLVRSFESMCAAVAPGMRASALRELYARIPATNFSDEVLSLRPSDLAVLPAHGLGWSDLGEPQRAMSVLSSDIRLHRRTESMTQGLEVPA
jgi:mannose-1-phosphate guanylyltransferase